MKTLIRGLIKPKVKKTQFVGCIDVFKPNEIKGWFVDQLNKEVPVNISFYFKGNEFLSVEANESRPDIAELGLGSEFSGVCYSTRYNLFDTITSEEELNCFTISLNGTRMPLSMFISKDLVIPKLDNISAKISEKVFFYPNYTINNHYQKQLYKNYPEKCSVEAGDLVEAFKFLKENIGASVTFHLHWIKPIIDGKNETEIEENAKSFLTLLHDFQKIGGWFVWTIHNKISHDVESSSLRTIEINFRQKLASIANVVHLHSETAIPSIKEYYNIPRKKVEIIPHGNYIGLYPNTITREEARKKLGIEKDDFVLSCIGQLRPYKGIEELLIAYSNIQESNKKVKLLIAGKSVHPYKEGDVERMSSLIPGVIVVERYIPDYQLQFYMLASDFAVIPYKDILTSGSILNAISFGLPVIAPEIGMIPEVIDENSGILYNPSDDYALYNAIHKASQLKKVELELLSKNAVNKAEIYDWKSISETAYKQLSDKGSYKKDKKKIDSEEVSYVINENFQNNEKDESVAIVVVNYENTVDSRNLVDSLKDSTFKKYDVLLIDNASPSESINTLLVEFDDTTLIRTEKNLGYAGGNNLGIVIAKEKKYKYIWILNPDTIVPVETLQQLVDKAKAFPDVTVHGTIVLNGNDQSKVQFGGGIFNTDDGFETELLYVGEEVSSLPKSPIETDYVSGASIFMDLDKLDKENLIPERYFLYYEETDWCYSLKSKGKNLLIHPDIYVLHNKRSEEKGLPANYYLYYYIRSTILFTTKYWPKKVESTISKLYKNFIDPWSEKIKQRSPNYYPIATSLINAALEDGLNNVTGPIDLSTVYFSKADGSFVNAHGQGVLDRIENGIIHGWAVDPNKPWLPSEVVIYIDGIPAGKTFTNLYRADLEEQGINNGFAGFEFTIPHRFNNGKERKISLAFSATGKEFGSPVEQVLYPLSPNYRAYIEKPGNFQINGWAWDKNRPENPLKIEVRCNNEVVDTVIADDYRVDLERAGMRKGACAFSANIPPEYAAGGVREFSLNIVDGPEIARKEISWTAKGKKISFRGNGPKDYFNWSFFNTEVPANAFADTFKKVFDILNDGKNALKNKYLDRKQEDLISIIMPAFNRAEVICDAIDSVINQSYTNWELIIVDDGSKDNLNEVLSKNYADLLESNKISLYRYEFNRGVSNARNQGLKLSKGKYIAYLDSDNQWDESYLLIMRNKLLDDKNFNIAYCGQQVMNYRQVKGELHTDTVMVRGSAFNPALIENRNFIDLNVFFHERSLYESHGGFNVSMRRLVDWELILRYTYNNKPLFVPALLNSYSFGKAANQITAVEPFGNSHQVLKQAIPNLIKKDNIECNSTDDLNVLLLMSNEDKDILNVLLALKSYSYKSDIVIVGEPNTEQFKIATKLLAQRKNTKIIDVEYKEGENFEESSFKLGMEQISKDSHLLLLRDNVILDRNTIPSFIKSITEYPEIGIAVSRRIVKPQEKRFHKYRKYAVSDADYDLAAEILSKSINNIDVISPNNIIEVNKVPNFCTLINKDLIKLVSIKEEINTPKSLFEFILNAGSIAEGKITAYLPDVRAYDVSYLN